MRRRVRKGAKRRSLQRTAARLRSERNARQVQLERARVAIDARWDPLQILLASLVELAAEDLAEDSAEEGKPPIPSGRTWMQ